MAECVTCELVRRRDRREAPPWDHIRRTPEWDVVHAFGTAVEGWLVLVARRHITSMADMSDAEATALGPLIKAASRALQSVVDCKKTYVVQFAEHVDHPHVHVHVIPRAVDLPDEQRGPRIFSQLGASGDDAVADARMNEIAAQLDAILPD